jgi:phosphopantothenoylcysteine decarboxylase/phosphopantothenate--cysteine ligase
MNIVLGVTGSISAYKAVDILRLFQKNGHQVSVIMTRAAQELIPAYTFETFAPGNVFTKMFVKHQDPVLHVSICDRNDLLLIAPATANIIGKMANGIADDLLSSTYLAFYKKVIIAPAMNTHMLEHPAVRENIARLKAWGVEVIEPVEGSLACKYEGKGKLPAPEDIYNYVVNLKLTHV